MTTKKLTDYTKQKQQTPVRNTEKTEQIKPTQARTWFKKESEFQETPIGKIPKEWIITTLSQLINFEKGKKPSKLFKEEKSQQRIPYLKAEYLRGLEPPEWCEPTDVNVVRVKKTDIIMIWDGSYSGEVFIGFEGALASTMIKITPKESLVDSKYLYYWLKKYNQTLRSTTIGTGIPHVNKKIFENLLIPTPPLMEQKVIAEILSTVDSAIDRVRRLVERAEKLKKGLMQELFTKGIGHKEYKETPIGKIPKDWKIAKLGSICRFKRGFSYRSTDITDERTSLRFITIDDIEKEGGLKKYAKKVYIKNPSVVDPEFLLNNGDILIANTDMTKGFIIGAPILIKNLGERCAYSMDLTRLILDKTSIHSEFLYYYLMHPQVRRFMKSSAQGTNVLHLNHEIIKNLLIPIPSLKEQKVIAEILYTVDEYIRVLEARLERLEHVKKWLMDVLLTGKVRVIVEPSSGGSSG